MRLSIRSKFFGLFAAIAVLPVVLVSTVLLPRYERAVRQSEDRTQLAIIGEVSTKLDRHIDETRRDALGLAAAVRHASDLDEQRGALAEPLIEEALATRESLAYARLEIPDAQVDTVLAKAGIDTSQAPSSTAELRERALESGSAFQMRGPSLGVLVVPIPPPANSAIKAPAGFLTVPVFFSQFRHEFEKLVKELEDVEGRGSIAVIDGSGALIVGKNVPREAGAQAGDLPIFARLPPVADRGIDLGGAAEFDQEGVRVLGTTRTLGKLGWTVGYYRPKSQALQAYRSAQVFAYSALGILVAGVLLLSLAASRAAARPILALADAARRIGKRDWPSLTKVEASTTAIAQRGDELGVLARAVREMATDIETSERTIATEIKLRADLSRFMSRELVDRIVRGEHAVELGGTRNEITVLFVDMVAFTTLAEKMAPERVLGLLNELFTVLAEVVFRHGGVIDKFIGDCMMAIWGAPDAVPDHASRAVAAADDMMRFLEVVAEGFREGYKAEVRLAIGVHSGAAIVGNIGSRTRMDFTAVGDVVNVAARLESIAAPNQVLISEATQALAPAFTYRRLGERKLLGRAQPIRVYELVQDLD
ncbi:MAG: adenylate/guanylate cyclase domain-containing protein [Polyangiaceae bacterium]